MERIPERPTYQKMHSTLFRRDAKSGIKEIMLYLRAREACKDPILWPPRPSLSIFGVKNALERLRSDFAIVEDFTGHKTTGLIRIVDDALNELHSLRLNCPPTDRRDLLGIGIVSAYVTLNRPKAFEEWADFTIHDLEFNLIQVRNSITLRTNSVHFEHQADVACNRDGHCEAAEQLCNVVQGIKSKCLGTYRHRYKRISGG